MLDPEHTLQRLESGWALYRQYFVWKWRRSLRKKQAAWPTAYDLSDVIRLDNLTDMTDVLVRHYGGFPSLEQYLRGYAIVGDALAPLEARTRIISAADDPIIPAADLVRIARPRALEVTLTRFGGHCGYYAGGDGPTWIEREVVRDAQRIGSASTCSAASNRAPGVGDRFAAPGLRRASSAVSRRARA